MFSYKMKNYALLDEQGRLRIKGSGLRSRGLELFQREWLEEMLTLLLKGEKEKIPELYNRYADDVANHRKDISWLAKTETLQDSLENYQAKVKAKKRNAAAPYELALKAERPYQAGDQYCVLCHRHQSQGQDQRQLQTGVGMGPKKFR